MLHDVNDLVELIKNIAVKAVEASRPADYCFGKVTSKSPLKILVEQKITLDSAQLILTRNVTDFDTKIDGSESSVKNALEVGDDVILLRQKGGQKYLVMDRVVSA